MPYPLNEQFLRDLHECLMKQLPANEQESFDQFLGSEDGPKNAYAMADEMIKIGWVKTGHAI